MGLKQWFEEKPPIHERLDNSSELFALAPWRKFPKLKIFGWVLILDIDEKAYVTAKAIAPNAIAALETWAAGQDEKLEQERSMKNMTTKPAAASAPAQTEVEVQEA